MKKKTVACILGSAMMLASLTACTGDNGETPVLEASVADTEAMAPTEAETVEPETAEPTEAVETQETNETEPTETESEDDSETSPLMLWEYEGYVDECKEYTWWDEFAGCDYDGDGATDRVYRSYTADSDLATYRIEFGNGRTLEVPEGWNTGFPHVQAGDLNNNGEVEVLFTLTYDTSTDPLEFGDMWLFFWDGEFEEYKEEPLPLATGENGARCLTIAYKKTAEDTLSVQVAQNGFSCDVVAEEDQINNWYYEDTDAEDILVYYADLDKDCIHCYTQMFSKSGQCLTFDLVSKDYKFEIENMEYTDEPFYWWE